jgi:hypothetical protein
VSISGVVWALVLSVVVMGCAGSTASSSASVPPLAAPSQGSASPSSGPPASDGSSGSRATRYATAQFGIPLTVTVAAALASTPTDDSAGLLSGTATGNDNNRVRFLVPAEVYPPDSTRPVPTPKDFVGYIKGLADHGGVFSDVTTTTVDGLPATLLTAKATRALDGSLGCPTIGAEQGEGCFGLQPDLALRIAVMDAGGKPLLAWARTDGQNPDAAFLAVFEDMLATVDFK